MASKQQQRRQQPTAARLLQSILYVASSDQVTTKAMRPCGKENSSWQQLEFGLNTHPAFMP
jgi:hypothetical protein